MLFVSLKKDHEVHDETQKTLNETDTRLHFYSKICCTQLSNEYFFTMSAETGEYGVVKNSFAGMGQKWRIRFKFFLKENRVYYST